MTSSFRFLYCAVLLILVVRANCSVQSHLAPTTVEKSVEVHGATDEHHDDHDSTPVDPCKAELGQPGWGTTSAECERCVGSNKHCHLCYYPDALRGICVSDSVAECPYGSILKKSNRFTAAPQCEALAANEETEIELTCAGEDLKRDWVSCPKKLAISKRGPTFFQLAHEVLGNFDNRHYHGSEVEVVFSVSCPLAMRVYDCEQVLQSKKLSLRIRKLLPILDSINDAEKLHSMADFHFTNMIKAYSHIADAVEAVPDDVKLFVIGVGTGGIAAQSHPPFLDKAAEHVKTHMINIGTHDNAVNSGNLKIDFVPSYYPIDPDIYDRFSNDQTVVEAEGGKKVGELVKQLKEAAVNAIRRIATKLEHLKSQGAVCVVMICMGPRFARYPGLVALKVASPVFLVQAYDPDENSAAVAIPLAPQAKLPQEAHSSVPWFTMLHATFFSKNLKLITPHDLGL